MAYSKQNFQDGQILTAANLEKMENGIIAGQGAKNLLVNSNFRNPINTNGQTNYSGSTASSIDKWGLIKGASDSIISLKISNNGIILSKSANVSSFEQKLSIDISNKQITYAIKTSEGITLGTCIASATANYIRIGTHTGYLSTVSSNGITTFSIYFNDTSSDSITLEWAALYEGNYTKDTLPDYMPNTKQVEMLNCGIPLTPHNLLDNSNFINAINQGGQTSWTAHGVYCIDRWKTESANNAANISYTKGSGITLTPSSKNYAGIIQQFENYSSMTGKVYTIAVCINNVWYSGTFTMGATPSGGVVLSNGIRIYSASGYNVLIRNPAGQSAITIQRAALYEGSYDASTLPAYQPKGYAAELAECQRYFERLGVASSDILGAVAFAKSGAKSVLISIKYQPKRIGSPTISLGDVSKYRLLLRDAVNASVFSGTPISSFDDIIVQSPFASFRVTIPNPLDRDCWVILQRADNSDGAYIDVNADL